MGAFKYTKASLALVICTLLINQSSSYPYTMEQICAQWWDSGYIGNPSSCKGWGYCQGQKLVSWGSCGSGLVFNSQTGSCSSAANTICSTSMNDTCAAATSPTYVANPNDCTQYGYCYGNGTLGVANCPTGQMFLAAETVCVYASSCPQDTICRFMKSDIFVGDPNNCGQFLQCLNGEAKPGKCESTTYPYYNAATGRCEATSSCSETDPDAIYPADPDICKTNFKATAEGDETTDGSTTDGTTSGTTDGTTSGTTSGTTAADDGTTSGSGTSKAQFFADGKTCYGYYVCTSTSGPGTWSSCPKGTHFNPTTQQCVSPAAFACTHNRCGNLNSQFVTALNTNCKDYIVCSSNTTAECVSTYPYFNEVTGICQKTEPGYAVCKAT